jgi:uncharacterized membrane protein
MADNLVMDKVLAFLETTAGKMAALIGALSLILGSIYTVFQWEQDLARKDELTSLATRVEVAQQMNDLAIEIVSVTIMGYEDDLVELSFLVESGEATPMDRVKHQNTINRLNALREKLGRLEDAAIELQKTSGRVENILTGTQVE